MTSLFGRVSRLLNRALGGRAGQSFCARIARSRGHDCLFCRVIGALARDVDHCWHAMLHDLRR